MCLVGRREAEFRPRRCRSTDTSESISMDSANKGVLRLTQAVLSMDGILRLRDTESMQALLAGWNGVFELSSSWRGLPAWDQACGEVTTWRYPCSPGIVRV